MALPEALWPLQEGCGGVGQMRDARCMQGVHADNFMKDIVARATVLIDDDRRFCTLTLCVAARRSVAPPGRVPTMWASNARAYLCTHLV